MNAVSNVQGTARRAYREMVGANVPHVHRLRRRHERVLVVGWVALGRTDTVVGLVLLDVLVETLQSLEERLLLRHKNIPPSQSLA